MNSSTSHPVNLESVDASAQQDVNAIDLEASFSTLKQQYLTNKQPSLIERKTLLNSLKNALIENQQSLLVALNRDYGKRPDFDSLMAGCITECSAS